MIKVTEKFDRKKLIEGRNFGFGFAILKPTNKECTEFDTMNAFTACKDYLNDFFFTEEHEKDLPRIHGFKHKYTGYFKDKEYFYLGIRAVHYKNGNDWAKYDQTQNTLLTNNENLLDAINNLEEYLGLSKTRTTVVGTNDEVLVLKCPIAWAKRGYLISLLTLYIRCFANIKKGKTPLKKMFKQHKDKMLVDADAYLYPNFEKLLKVKKKEVTFSAMYPALDSKINIIHNGGIQHYLNHLKIK